MTDPASSTGRLPVLFVGHGAPTIAIEHSRFSDGLAELAAQLPRPRALLVVSAHWLTRFSRVTTSEAPATLHDFSGFAAALDDVTYPAPGDTTLAWRVRELLTRRRVELDDERGFDHGTWTVLHRMWPRADVPVVQLSISWRLDEPGHYSIGRALAPLRDEGVLILASGNIVHNLGDAITRQHSGSDQAPPWARTFDQAVAHAVSHHDTPTLLSLARSDAGRQAHPRPDHWFPLLYALGATDEHDSVRFANEGFDWGSISMRCIVWEPT